MRTVLAIFPALLLLGSAFSAPTTTEDNETIIVDETFFPNELAIYTAKHDIVNIMVPLNSLNFGEDDDDDNDNDSDGAVVLFFVEADIKDGEYQDQGLYVYKEGKATLLLEHGRDSAARNKEGTEVYFGAQDGLYIYNDKTNSANKYGSLSDNIIGIAAENGTDSIYILTADHEVYKVSDNGNVKTKVDSITHAKQIIFDFSNNLYFYGEDKVPYVYDGNNVKKIEGTPLNPSEVRLVRPAFLLEESVPFVVDDKIYLLYANGTSELSDFELKVKPTAYGMEAALVQYYAHDKKLYEFNILTLLLGDIISDLKNYLDEKKNNIEDIATRSIIPK